MATQPFPRVKQEEKSLYERLGGIFAIAAVVNQFSDALIMNPLVGQGSPNEHLDDWSTNHLDRLPGLKWMRTLWLADLAGGPYKFVPTKPGKCPFGLENAHAEFQITPEEFDEVARELGLALDCFGVPAKEKGEVLAVFAQHKPEVTHAVTGGEITCPVQH
jgi:hemoglobin